MADTTIDFGVGNTERYYEIPAPPVIPDGDFCFGWWQRMPSPGLGSRRAAYDFATSLGDPGNLLITSAMYGSFGDRATEIVFFGWPDAGGSEVFLAGRYLGGDDTSTDFLCIIQRRGTDIQGDTIPIGSEFTGFVSSEAHTLSTITPPSSAYIGTRRDGAGNYLEDPLGEFFFLSGDSLDTSEVAALALGASILTVRPTPDLYLKFRESNATEPDLSGNGYDATQHGTGWTLTDEFFPDSSSGTTINVLSQALELSTFPATVSSNKSVAAQLEALLLTANPVTVSSNRNISGAVESLAVSTFGALVSSNRFIAGALETIALQTYAAGLSLGIQASTEQISLSTFLSIVSSNRSIAGNLESIALQANSANISVGASIGASLEAIVVQAHPAQVILDVNLSTQLEAILLTELSAQITLGQNLNAQLESLVVTPFGATLTLDHGITAHLESLTLSTFKAVITTPIQPIDSPGLQYTIDGNKLHYSMPVSRLHFTFRS